MEKKRIIFIVGITVVVMIIAGAILYFVVPKSSSNQPVIGSVYHDPSSGESIAENSHLRQSAKDSNLPDQPTYLGFSKLIDYGLSSSQLIQVKSALYNYSQKQSTKFTEISLVIDSVRQPDPAPGSRVLSYEFNIKVNRSDDYFMRVEFTDTSSCTVTIYKADKTTLLFTQ
jgi:hypothetical protein